MSPPTRNPLAGDKPPRYRELLPVEQSVRLAPDRGDRHCIILKIPHPPERSQFHRRWHRCQPACSILSKGSVVHEGRSAELRADHHVIQRYLGV